MWEWHNKEETWAFSAVYSECCRHKWTVEEWRKGEAGWNKTGFYTRFDTLEEARDFARSKLFLA